MSWDDAPRMCDCLSADQLDDEACVDLATVVLEEFADDYLATRKTLNKHPNNKDAQANMNWLQRFYQSEYFAALSCGLMSGRKVMAELDRRAGGDNT